MAMYISISLCLFLFIISLICSKYNIFSPSVITSGIWLSVLFLYTFLGSGLNPLTDKFLSAIDIWVTLFCVSSLFIQALSLSNNNRIKPSQLARNIFFYASLVTFPLLILHAYEIVKLGTSTNWMADMRSAAVGGIKGISIEDSNPFYTLIWLGSYLIELNCYSKENKKRVFVLFLMYLMYAFITMSKTNILTLFLSTIFVLYSNKFIKFNHIAISGIIILFVFLGVQSLRSNSTASKNPTSEFVTIYALSSAPAFETVKSESSVQFGENVFRFFYAVKYKLGLTKMKPNDTILGFVNVGVVTNTYTVLYPYYKDFGLSGIAFFSILLGLLLGFVYNKAENGNVIFVVLYSFFLFELVMQLVGDLFFTNFSLNLKLILVATTPYFISRYELFSYSRKQLKIIKNKVDE
ncbi:oligosaccharide repeat unit polymerase [Paludibacter propionicigenes]